MPHCFKNCSFMLNQGAHEVFSLFVSMKYSQIRVSQDKPLCQWILTFQLVIIKTHTYNLYMRIKYDVWIIRSSVNYKSSTDSSKAKNIKQQSSNLIVVL